MMLQTALFSPFTFLLKFHKVVMIIQLLSVWKDQLNTRLLWSGVYGLKNT